VSAGVPVRVAPLIGRAYVLSRWKWGRVSIGNETELRPVRVSVGVGPVWTEFPGQPPISSAERTAVIFGGTISGIIRAFSARMTAVPRSQARRETLTSREAVLEMAATTTGAFGTVAPPLLESGYVLDFKLEDRQAQRYNGPSMDRGPLPSDSCPSKQPRLPELGRGCY